MTFDNDHRQNNKNSNDSKTFYKQSQLKNKQKKGINKYLYSKKKEITFLNGKNNGESINNYQFSKENHSYKNIIFESQINQENLDFFNNLYIILLHIFLSMRVPKQLYEESTSLEKIIIKILMLRKFRGKAGTYPFQNELKSVKIPLNFSCLKELTMITSNKRRNEVIFFIIKDFLKKNIQNFQKENISPTTKEYLDFTFTAKKFFEKFYIIKSDKELRNIMSCFFKLTDKKNKMLWEFMNPCIYGGNFSVKNILKRLNESNDFSFLLKKYFDTNEKLNIFEFCRNSILSKLKSKVYEMEHEFVFTYAKDESFFLKDLEKKVKGNKYKFPMLLLDIRKSVDYIVENII